MKSLMLVAAILLLQLSPLPVMPVEGDRLIEVDGHPSRDFTPLQLRDLLSRPGETRDLRLVHGSQMLRIALKLEQRL